MRPELLAVSPVDVTAAVQLRSGPEPRACTLLLARPERGNAIDSDFAAALLQAARGVSELVAGGGIDCVLIAAEGKAFSVGGDLRDFPTDGDRAVPHIQAMAAVSHEAMALLLELPVPVIAQVQGVAAGAGIGLAVFADVVIASTHARFKAGYPAVGLSPDCATTWLLPRLVGERRAMDLLLTNRSVDATEAERWGLVSRVVAPEELEDAARQAVRAALQGGRDAAIETKRLLRSAPQDTLRAHMADEGTTIARLGGTPTAVAARTAFLETSRQQERSRT
ncbi:2-(1,2-epoxy-1,2-dihydrophenyl)acetyl-CoA isomerase [Jatrophihabitans sp. GAS493]|uniref:enoyl-CoA hydratase/isomerase family protein n=1 Tax=Jatrophihabitans sp. GAS493 TaxID=1907575 RepID=UPI000BB7A5FA|nr:enoyl-CoA hydratase/isomerase family protein [Jatrophihabitans sp. GAS493]SOD74660.1 2-(1,2-epoxy-1,2-dihydrophenyl)acetyl-CoA isomerase [Jatrophihabitans sp. GAS493]